MIRAAYIDRRRLTHCGWTVQCLLVITLLAFAGIARAATYSNAPTVFNWIDASGHTPVVWTGAPGAPSAACTGGSAAVDDDITEALPLGFTFNFGGVDYTSVRVMSNGRLQFNNTFCGYGTQATGPPRTYPYPSPNANLVRTLRVYGADLDPSGGGTVSYAALGNAPNRTFVVTWSNVPEWAAGGSAFNLQVVLHENGDFVYQFGASNNPSQGHAEIGWELTTTDHATYGYTNIGALANTAVRFYIPAPVAYYPMDEARWGGVIDATGNGYDGVAAGTAQTVPGGRICRGGDIPLNTAKNTIDAVDTGIAIDSQIGGSGAINFWYKGNGAWNDGSDRMLLDGTSNNSRPFFLSKRADGRLRFVLQDSGNNVFVAETGTHGGATYAAGTWHHIAITWTLGGSGRMSIYLNGTLDRQVSFGSSSALDNAGGTLFIGDNQGKAVSNNPTNNSANGVIDEVRIYNYETPASVINRDRLLSHSCSLLDHFDIAIGGAAASTCADKTITITAKDAANATVTTYTGTVNLTTSSGHGDWLISVANGTLDNGTADDGVASYTFVSADAGVATLALRNSHADDLTVSVADSATPGSPSTSEPINFRDNAFVIGVDAIQVAGRDQAMTVAMWEKDATALTCQIAASYDGDMTLKAWLTLDGDHPVAAALPSIGGSGLSTNPAAPSPLTLTFTNGVANFALASTDVGKYALNLTDDTRVFATGVDITGGSSVITTRPFGLGLTDIKRGAVNNPGGTAPGSLVFAAAGAAFEATVGAYLWSGADDADDNGVPDAGADVTDNGLAPAFAWATALSATGPFTPAAGTPGNLTGTLAIAAGAFAGGAATVTDLAYSEVGSLSLQADSANFLNTPGANLSVTSAPVGRFVPAYFDVAVTQHGCATFTYSGQAFEVTATAYNAGGIITRNYHGPFGFAKDTTFSNAGDTTNFAGHVLAGADYVDGVGIDSVISHTFPLKETPPATLTMRAQDTDGVTSNGHLEETTEARSGRVRIHNAYGWELRDLAVPLAVEYYKDATDMFVVNAADACTDVGLSLGNYQGGLDAGETCVQDTGSPGSSGAGCAAAGPGGEQFREPPVTGDFNLHLQAPGAGNQGSVDVTASSPAWLRYDWNGDAVPDDAKGRASFGIYEGPRRNIYTREVY